MKKAIRIIVPVVLAVALLLCTGWYLMKYDLGFTRDVLLTCARYSEENGHHTIATWFYNRAYAQAKGGDAVAIELAQQYAADGNYTKAEFTLRGAIVDGGGVDVYVALCRTFVEQDKLQDAVKMLSGITNPQIKEQLEKMRPATPVLTPDSGEFSHFISVTIESEDKVYYSIDGFCPSVKMPYAQPVDLPEGETVINAIAVNELGLVSVQATGRYTIGGVIEPVEFVDSAVETEIRTILNVGTEKQLLTSDLWTITDFTVPAAAQDYSDLRHMINLESLTIRNGVSGQIANISAMAKLETLRLESTSLTQDDLKIIAPLPCLKNLTMADAGLTGIAPIADAPALETLNVSGNTLINLDALKGMTGLKELNVSRNAISDISALASCTGLTMLDISGNTVTSLAPLSGLTGLIEINASTNSLTDLGDIGKLSALSVLKVNGNQLTTLGTISGCTGLTELDVSNNALTEINCLASVTSLMQLNFSFNQVTALPDFDNACALVGINGSNNQLDSLEGLSGLQNLNTVDMDYNEQISSVACLADCPVLIRVNVFGTKVTDVSMLTDMSIEVNYNPIQ